jgi:hypothetical protein
MMKNKLLIAFLTFATIPFFAAKAQQSTNAELLAHLNNVKIGIKEELQELSHAEKKFQQKLGQDYNVIINISNDFLDITQLTQNYFKIEKIWFYLICNEMKSIRTIHDVHTDNETNARILAKLNIENFNEKNLEEIDKKGKQIIDTLLIKHCNKDDIRTYEEKMTSLVYSDNSIELTYIIINQKILMPLLQDIENKIKELEQA